MLNFISDWQELTLFNQVSPNDLTNCKLAAKIAGELLEQSLTRQFLVADVGNDHSWLRLSKLGKPALEQLAYRFFAPPSARLNTKAQIRSGIFVDGDRFEGYFWFLAAYLGYECESRQELVYWNEVPGHTDGIIICPHTKQRWLVELKTMNSRKFKILQDSQSMSFIPEYVTQLACYMEATGLPGIWVVKNKDTNELMTLVPDDAELEAARNRARKLVKGFKAIERWEESFDYFRPAPVAPVYRAGAVTGYKVPDSMLWSDYKDLIYFTKPDKRAWQCSVIAPYYQVPNGYESKRERWIEHHAT